MSQVVLALLMSIESAALVLAAADRLASLLGGVRIEAMVARTAPISTIMPTEEILSRKQEQKIRDHEEDRAKALRRVFDVWVLQHQRGHPAGWIDQEGTPETLMETWGSRADYIVVGRPSASADHAEHSALSASLFATDRPVLIVPPQAQPNFGRVIAIAWRDDKFTLRAVLAALRCCSEAGEVHVLMGRRHGQPPAQIPEALTEHEIRVTPHELLIGRDVFGAQLLAEAHAVKADLLVMGAFVHNSWHNMLFGGVTKYVLSHADIPVLMRH